jgi:hypothetical protein
MSSSGTASSIFTFPGGHRVAAYIYLPVHSSLHVKSNNVSRHTVSTQDVYISTSLHTNSTVLINSFFTIAISLLQFQLHTVLMYSPHDSCSGPCHALCPVSKVCKSNSPCVVQRCRFTLLCKVVWTFDKESGTAVDIKYHSTVQIISANIVSQEIEKYSFIGDPSSFTQILNYGLGVAFQGDRQ